MVGNVEVGKSDKRILVVGYLGYHEETIVKPILAQLINNKICRLGGNMDFFISDNHSGMIENWVSSLNGVNLKDWDIVFFVDYWNMVVPIFLYKKGIENPNCKFVGICLGTVQLKDDVALGIPLAHNYEKFLLEVYDNILVPYDWLKRMLGDTSNISVALLPTDLIQERIRPIIPPSKTIIYAHRFTQDKGCDDFISFVSDCRHDSDMDDTKFIVTDEGPKNIGIDFIGRVNQEGLKELCQKGGYAWSSARSETFGYAVLDLVSYGLTPLLNNHPAYLHFPNKYKYGGNDYYKFDRFSFSDVKQMILNELYMTNEEWEQMIIPMKDNSRKMAEAILS